MHETIHLSVFMRSGRRFKFDLGRKAFERFQDWVSLVKKEDLAMVDIAGNTITLLPHSVECYAENRRPHNESDYTHRDDVRSTRP